MASDSDSSYSSSSSDEDSEERRRREKKEKKERKRKREKKEKKERKRKEKKERKKEKKEKKEKKSKKSKHESASCNSTWGKHGIIKDGDFYDKQEEFPAWLTEVKGVQQEACGQREMKEHFSTFCEDYNTSTLPGDKYYNLRAWYVKDQARRASEQQQQQQRRGDDDEGGFERTSFDDEGERQRDLQRQRTARADATARVMASAMRSGEGLVADMKEQEASKQAMRAAYQTGHVDKARDMAEKLDPKYVSPEELKKIFGGAAPLNMKKPGGMGGGH